MMEYAELIREIQSGRIRPVVFLFGDETYWMDMAIRLLREKTVSPETRDFNEDILYAEETDGEAVIQAASSFPLMAERRLVVVKSIQKFNAEDRKRLLLYAQAPLQSTCLVCTANDVDRRQSFWSEFTRITASAECKILYENQAAAWVEKAVGSRGGRITSEAALALVQQAGVSLWNLSHEVEKLLTFAHGKKQLDLEDVEAVAGFSRKYANWDFTDAVGGKQLARALDILRKLLEEKSSAVGLIMDLHRRVLLLLRMRAPGCGHLGTGAGRDSKDKTFFYKTLHVAGESIQPWGTPIGKCVAPPGRRGHQDGPSRSRDSGNTGSIRSGAGNEAEVFRGGRRIG